MGAFDSIRRFVDDPPPAYAFEFSEAGVAWMRANGGPAELGFEALPAGAVAVSPLKDNIADADAVTAELRRIAAPGGKRRPAVLILPDYSGRVTVIDFDSFPADAKEQASLVRFRVKKSMPFDIEAAAVSFHAQPVQDGKQEVVVAAVSLEVLAPYEAALRMAGFDAGLVTISSLAAMDLLPATASASDVGVIARLTGRVLTLLVVKGRNLRLTRCVELTEATLDEITNVLYPTLAYIEDELDVKPSGVVLCGFAENGERLRALLDADLGIEVSPLRSAHGTPAAYNAGLIGYLEARGAA